MKDSETTQWVVASKLKARMHKKLAIITSHPVQYYAPLFRLLAGEPDLAIRVFYTWGKDSVIKHDPGFGKVINWDIPVLDGYDYTFLENKAKVAGTGHFRGIVNPEIIYEVEQFDPDAVLVYGWSWHSHLKAIRVLSGKYPIWFRGDSHLLDERGGIRSAARSIFLRWLYRYIDKAFYVGSANRAYFERYGMRPHQLVWAPHAIDNGRFAMSRCAEAQMLRRSLGIESGEQVVLFAGKLEPKKCPDLLLNAFTELNLPGTHLVFAGSGMLEESLKAAAVGHSRVHFLPFINQSQMPALYQACQLFCLPSQGPGETWGLAVNEAMAAGRAVLVSDKVGCAPDLVKEGVNGAVFKAGNLPALKEQLVWLLRPETDLLAMGRGSATLVQEWSFEKQVAVFVAELNKL